MKTTIVEMQKSWSEEISMSKGTFPFISIVTANWNGAGRLEKFLDDARNIDYPKEQMEFVIHDNASSDASCELIECKFAQMRREGWRRLQLIRSSVHPGLNQAYCNAYAATSGNSEFILEMDNDIRLPPETLRRLVTVMRSHERAAAVGCNVRYAAPPFEQNCGAIFHDWWLGRDNRIDLKDVSSCDAVLDCVMLLRRAALDELTYYFDPDFYFFCLGTDLFLRLGKKGWLTIYDPEALAFHDAGRTTGRHSSLTIYLSVRDGVVLHLNHNNARLVVFLLRGVISALKHWIFDCDLTRLRGMFDGLRKRPFDLDWWNGEMKGASMRRDEKQIAKCR